MIPNKTTRIRRAEIVTLSSFLVLSCWIISSHVCLALKPGLVLKDNGGRQKDLLEGMPGQTLPLGRFDPLNIASPENCSPETINWFRAAELKHGRVAMLSCVGYLTQAAGLQFPFIASALIGRPFAEQQIDMESFAQLNPFKQWEYVPTSEKLLVIGLIGITETLTELKKPHYMMSGKMPQIVYPEFDFSEVKAITLFTKQNRELNNGRLAMIGIMSFIADYYIPGSVPPLHDILSGKLPELPTAESLDSFDANNALESMGSSFQNFLGAASGGFQKFIDKETEIIESSIKQFQIKAEDISSSVGQMIDSFEGPSNTDVSPEPAASTVNEIVPRGTGNEAEAPPVSASPEVLRSEPKTASIAPSTESITVDGTTSDVPKPQETTNSGPSGEKAPSTNGLVSEPKPPESLSNDLKESSTTTDSQVKTPDNLPAEKTPKSTDLNTQPPEQPVKKDSVDSLSEVPMENSKASDPVATKDGLPAQKDAPTAKEPTETETPQSESTTQKNLPMKAEGTPKVENTKLSTEDPGTSPPTTDSKPITENSNAIDKQETVTEINGEKQVDQVDEQTTPSTGSETKGTKTEEAKTRLPTSETETLPEKSEPSPPATKAPETTAGLTPEKVVADNPTETKPEGVQKPRLSDQLAENIGSSMQSLSEKLSQSVQKLPETASVTEPAVAE